MNQLFLKNKKTNLVIIFIGLFSYGFTLQLSDKKNDPFFKLCEDADAYYQHSYQDLTYVKGIFGLKRYVTIDSKMVVNTSIGAENYAFLVLDEYVSNHLSSIEIKTHKKDGTIIKLDSSLVFSKKTNQNKFGPINYPIPSVEPGDTIVTKYVYYENAKDYNSFEGSYYYDQGGYVYLYSDLHSLNTQFTIKTSPGETVRYKTYNGFPDPNVIANDTLIYLQFSLDKIKGIVDNENNCLPCEKPYFYYNLNEKKSDLSTWKDIYNEEFNVLTQPLKLDYEKKSYYNRWKRRNVGVAKDSSKFFQFKVLHNKVLEDFNMQPIVIDEFIKSSGYFLKKESFDENSIRRFFRQLLEDLEIEYWAVFGKSKRNGPIDNGYIRNGEYDHIFFAYKDDRGQMNFLYPHDEFYKYKINELPTSLYNTQAVLVKPVNEESSRKKVKFIDQNFKLSKVDSVSKVRIQIPGMDFKHNYIQQVLSSDVDLENRETDMRYRLKVSGGLYTDINNFYSTMDKDKNMSEYYDALSEFEGDDNTIQVDTVIDRIENNFRPYSLTLNAEGKLNNVVSFVNDNTISLSFDNLINHNKIEINPVASDLDYYLDYSYSDNLMLYLNFPCKIEILGKTDEDGNFKIESGEYNYQVRKIGENKLQLNSSYKILKNHIPDEKLSEIEKLNEEVKIAKNKKLIIKLIK